MPTLQPDPGRYWAGAMATALVAALVGVAGVVIFQGVFDIDLVTPANENSAEGDAFRYAATGFVGALVAADLLYLLLLSTPRPRAFFGWIMGLVIVVAAVIPFARTDDRPSAIATAGVNVVMGIAILSLLSSVAERTVRRVPEQPPLS